MSAKKLRQLLNEKGPITIIGAHNGLSAKLAEEAGFEGIWASGFEISAACGIPDANILTMDYNLSRAREMAERVSIPIIADCDNGYGNAVNVVHMVRAYEAAGIAGVCIEDNVFPKRCSFYVGVKRELAPVEEHAGKIRAAKDTQTDKDFVVIARTEALIAGWGMDEALRRGRAYADAGADMVLIHSKEKSPDEVIAFAKAWDRKTPLVCVPTTYKVATVPQLHEAGFKLMIFANHGLRASIKAMRTVFKEMREKNTTSAADPFVVPMTDVYAIVGVKQMEAEEKAFMPADVGGATAIVLAAGEEPELKALIEEKPRAMLDIRGKTILERQIEALNLAQIKDVAVVRGYKKEKVALPNIRTFDNDEYKTTGPLVSLFRAEDALKQRAIVMYGDILFEPSIVEKLLRSPNDITIVVDRAIDTLPPEGSVQGKIHRDLVVEDLPKEAGQSGHRFVGSQDPSPVLKVGPQVGRGEAHGEFIGMLMVSDQGAKTLRDTWAKMKRDSEKSDAARAQLQKAGLADLVQALIKDGHKVHAADIYKGWMEIGTFDDYQRAWASVR